MDQGLRATFYIIDRSLDKSQLEELKKLSKRPGSRWYEFIIANPPESISKPGNRIYFANRNQPSKNIIEAAGNWIVVISFLELKKHYDYLIDSFMRIRHGLAAVAVPTNYSVWQRLGIRSLSATSFVAFRKHFIGGSPYLETILTNNTSRLKLLKLADRRFSLFFLRDSSLLTTLDEELLPLRSRFVRPYFRIFFKLLGESLKSIYIVGAKIPKTIKAYLRQLNVKKIVFDDSIPVFITCRDRLSTLQTLVKWLEDEGLKNIIFIDNDSTYPPLLNYFSKQDYRVIRLRENAGHNAAWLCGVIQTYAKDKPYILTDPDILPADGSHGAVKRFIDLLNKYPKYQKVGFGLKIDDLPDTYELKPTVINWESQFWEKQKEKDVYIAEIDTTFAVYRPNTPYILSPALRTGGKYVARHEPWYVDSRSVDEEVKYYRAHADKSVGSWGLGSGDLVGVYEKHEDNMVHDTVQ